MSICVSKLQKKLKEVPVVIADDLSEAQVKAFRLVANQSANWAEWDEELLRLELEEDTNFDLNLTGFDLDEIDRLLHPTVKPLQLVIDAILDCSNYGETILDLFGGSGTTLIASEETHRKCCMMELDPKYVDTIVRRWQKHTGKQAIHAESGKTFDELEDN